MQILALLAGSAFCPSMWAATRLLAVEENHIIRGASSPIMAESQIDLRTLWRSQNKCSEQIPYGQIAYSFGTHYWI